MGDWVSQLAAMCEKNPIIRTFKGREIAENPANAERTYARHAATHMSLGDTTEHLSRIQTALTRNRRVFVGGVSGEYGLGKTSLAAYMWYQLERGGVVAVPPFSWTSLDEIFQTVYAWVRYKLVSNSDAQMEADRVYSELGRFSRTEEIARLVRDGMDQEKAEATLERLVRNGASFDRRVEHLFAMLANFTALVQRNGFRGIVVFTDELQESVSHLGAGKVFSTLFEIANTAQDYEGAFGFFIGMPANTRQAILDSRSDVMDRLVNQRLFVDLAAVYSTDFAKDLWNRYADVFGFAPDRYRIVDEDTLDALGQMTDSTRRDLGNGPRSVISAFRAIAEQWSRTRKTFTPLDLAELCLAREVLLGENSQWVARVKRLLQELPQEHDRLIKHLTIFPQGCSDAVLQRQGLGGAGDKRFIRSMLGEQLREVPGRGYVFPSLEGRQIEREAHYERSIRGFAVSYSPNDALTEAVTAMAGIVEEVLFGKPGDWAFQILEGKKWREGRLTRHAIVVGAFHEWKGKYPARRVAITITADLERGIPKVDELTHESSVYTAHLVLALVRERETGSIRMIDEGSHTYLIVLPVDRLLQQATILHRFMEQAGVTALAGLSLLHAMGEDEGIPQSEKPQLNQLLREVTGEIIAALFTKEMGQVKHGLFALHTSGGQQIRELLAKVCVQRFPEYHTLMVARDWKSKLQRYCSVLDKEQVEVLAKRGLEDLLPNVLPADLRRRAAELFGYSTTSPFEAYCQEMTDLFDFNWKKSTFRLRPHPAEQFVIELLDRCSEDKRIRIGQTNCDAVNSRELMDRFRDMGYTLEEVGMVFQLGHKRKYFMLHDNMIYRKPVTVEEYKAELTQRVQVIWKRLALLDELQEKALPVERSQIAAVEKEIPGLCSEEQYQALKATTVSMGQRLLERMLSKAQSEQQRMVQQVKRLREMATSTRDRARLLEEPVVGDLPWVGELQAQRQNQAVAWSGAVKLYQELKRDSEVLQQEHTEPWKDEALDKYVEYVQECIAIFTESTDAIRDLEVWEKRANRLGRWDLAVTAGSQAVQAVRAALDDGAEWQYKLESVHEAALQAITAADGPKEPTSVHDRYQQLLSELKAFAVRFHQQFQEEKQEWDRLLWDVGIRKTQWFASWSESDSETSYYNLRAEVAERLEQEAFEWGRKLGELNTELRYAGTVLGVSPDRIASLADGLSIAQKQANQLVERLADALSPEGMETLRAGFGQLSETYSRAAMQIRMLSVPSPASAQATALLERVPRQMSLRDVILTYAASDSQMDLDVVLQLVVELFRKNQVDILISPRRHQ